jgi:hypothetical protein
MSLTTEMLDAMLEAGCTAEQIAAVVKADIAKREAKDERRREKTRERVNRHRGNAMKRDVTVTSVTSVTPPPCSPPSFPPDPLNTPPYNPPQKLSTIDGDFDAWWSAYPKKVGKGQAVKAYRQARKKADAAVLLAGAERYAASKPDPQFTANPATWLNGERWLDEPVKRPPDSPETAQPRAEGNPPWAKWRAHLTRKGDLVGRQEFKDFQAAHGSDAANQRAIADAKQAGVPL